MKKLIFFIASAILLTALAVAATIVVTPSTAYTNDNLYCAVDSNPGAYLYSWYEGSNSIADGQTLDASLTTIGHAYTCKVYIPPTAYTPKMSFGEVSRTISNHAPTAPTLTLSAGPYFANSVITASASGSTDADGDTITYEYKYEIGSTSLSITDTLTCSGTCAKGNVITASARAYDGYGYSAWASQTLTISNSAPTAPTIAYIPSTVYYNSTITATALGSTDADGDAITYAYQFENSTDILQAWSATNTYTLSYALVNQTIILRTRASDGTAATASSVNIFANDIPGATPPSVPSVTFNYCSINSSSSPISLKDITNDDDIDGEKFKPLDEIEIKIKVENNDDDDEKDVIVQVVLVKNNETEVSDTDVDKSLTINEDDTETVVLNMIVPEDIEEGNYMLYVKVYDDDNENNCQQQGLSISVEKENHDVIFKNIEVPTSVYAGNTLTINGKAVSIGKEDEDKIKIMLTDDLGNKLTEERTNLDSGDSIAFVFNSAIPANSTAGMHTMTLKVYFDYDDGSYDGDYSESYKFNVSKQAVKEPVSIGVQEVTTQVSESELSKWLDDNWMMAVIIAVEVIAIGFVINTLKSRV